MLRERGRGKHLFILDRLSFDPISSISLLRDGAISRADSTSIDVFRRRGCRNDCPTPRGCGSTYATASGTSTKYRLSITCTRTYDHSLVLFRLEFDALFSYATRWENGALACPRSLAIIARAVTDSRRSYVGASGSMNRETTSIARDDTRKPEMRAQRGLEDE